MKKPLTLVVPLFLETDEAARAFWKKHQADMKSVSGTRLRIAPARSLEDLFSKQGIQRYPGLEARNLPCLWVEDNLKGHFLIELENLDEKGIRERFIDLADAAAKFDGAVPLEQGYLERRAQRKKGNPVPDPPPPSQPQPDHLLVRLGQSFGIGGVGIGIFFLLGQETLGKSIFPELAPGQAYQLLLAIVLFAFAVGISGLAVWVWQLSRKFSTLAAVLAFGVVALGATTFVLQPSDRDATYIVRATVLDPSGRPMDDARVWSSLGGEPKKVGGGWEFEIPTRAKGGKRSLTIYAAVENDGLHGQTEVELANDYAVDTKVALKRDGGRALLRGIVRDETGKAVPNARVSIPGYGQEAVTTDIDGSFRLPAHADEAQKTFVHAEKDGFTPLNQSVSVSAAPVELVLAREGKRPVATPPKVTPPAAVRKTGDAVIDRVMANLAALKRGPNQPTESQLAETLAPLFARPAFYSIRSSEWNYFLYPIVRTRLLLEEHVAAFKSRPESRAKIDQAVRTLVDLQNSVAGLYGPNFSISQHIARYVHSKEAFIQNLPSLQTPHTPEFSKECDRKLHEIVQSMKSAGFPIS